MAASGASRHRGGSASGLAVSVAIMALSSLLATARPAIAAPGHLDPSFGTDGVAVEATPPGNFEAMTRQPDGKIVTVGPGWRNDMMDFQIVRYTTRGVRDGTFGHDGRAFLDLGQYEMARAVTLQPDGKILVAGTKSPDWLSPRLGQGLVARYNSDGTLDTTFGTGGWVLVVTSTEQFRITAVIVQRDGRVVLAGSTWDHVALLVRLLPDGSADPTYSNGRPNFDPPQVGIPVRMYVAGAGILSDGRILVAGSTGYEDKAGGAITVRVTATGAVDPTFGDAGVARSRLGMGGFVHGMAVQPDGKVVLAGTPTLYFPHQKFITARLTADGHPDLSFGLGGEMSAPVGDAENATATSVAVAPDGSLFVGGWATAGPGGEPYVPDRHFVAHIRPSGALDPHFGDGGIAVVRAGDPRATIRAIGVQADGAPVAVGDSVGRSFVFRLQPAQRGGPVVGWGWNGWGQAGSVLGVLTQATVGTRARSDVAMVAAGAFHTLSVGADGRVWASGMNTFGQLGDGTTTDRSVPVSVAGLSSVIAVSAGAYHSLAVQADGSVWAWGWNGFGQLGDGTTVERHTPVRVAGLSGRTGVKVAAGAFHSLALASDGSVRAWGWNGFGQLGNGTTVDQHLGVQVADLSGAAGISTGAYHSLALRPDGSVLSWGWNSFGQLGDGTTVDRHRPVPVPGVTGVVTLGRGAWFHSMAVAADGKAWAWGWNGFGQLGDATTVERHAPVRVAVAGLVAAAGGLFHSLGVDASGTVRAWGWNGLGQLGDGTTLDRHLAVPVRLPAGLVTSVSAGAYHSVAG